MGYPRGLASAHSCSLCTHWPMSPSARPPLLPVAILEAAALAHWPRGSSGGRAEAPQAWCGGGAGPRP